MKLTDDDYRTIQKRVATRTSWEDIAWELGCTVKPLLAAVMAYKEPKRLPMVRAEPLRANGVPIRTHKDMSRQFIAWKRQHDGASKALAIPQNPAH